MTPIPFVRPGTWPQLRPGGLAEACLRADPADCRCALLGLPDDLGVRLNRGRPGAKLGPAALRAALARFGTPWDAASGRSLTVGCFDAGDVEPAAGEGEAALFETHDRVERAARALRERGLVVLAVGGGHDLSLPTLRALSLGEQRPLGGINLDAHLDVRARVGSGMPFRKLIEGGQLDARRFAEVGLGRFSNSREDWLWLSTRGARLVLADEVLDRGLDVDELIAWATRSGPAFLSVDLDGLDQRAAPGVSAPSPSGLDVRHACRVAEAAGRCPAVQHFDLMELNPRFDVRGRTARVAALLLASFLAGLEERNG